MATCPRVAPTRSSRPGRAPASPRPASRTDFLGRSVRVLRQEAPDVYDTLIARGALPIPLDLGEGPGDAVVCARRPLLESTVRQAAQAEPGVTVRAGVTITGILTQPGEVPVVTGVVTGTGEAIRGDIVIDAAGRRSPLPALLHAHGTRPAGDQQPRLRPDVHQPLLPAAAGPPLPQT